MADGTQEQVKTVSHANINGRLHYLREQHKTLTGTIQSSMVKVQQLQVRATAYLGAIEELERLLKPAPEPEPLEAPPATGG